MALEQNIQEDIKAAMKAKVREIIAKVGAANKALAGQSDGRTISAAVKELLS